MTITIGKIILLAMVQGAAEMLPVSSSAHVIVAEKWMGLDPSAPEMTFLLVMLHTGTMGAVLLYFWPRWRKLSWLFLRRVILATAFTGVVGLGLKTFIEKIILERLLNETHAEIEMLFKSLSLIAIALFSVGVLIIVAGRRKDPGSKKVLSSRSSMWIGTVQGLCLPFRGFSRSGATISTGILTGVSRRQAEDFSFALAVVLTPPVILRELLRLLKASSDPLRGSEMNLVPLLSPGILGMGFSFLAGLIALRWLSAWLEGGRWKFFGVYCIVASIAVCVLHWNLP